MKRYREDENGFVHFDNVKLSISGVHPYLGSQLPKSLNLVPDQIYMVYRPESELNNPDTIESFKGVPWFKSHVMSGDEYGVPVEEVGAHGSIGDNVYFSDGALWGNLHLFGSYLKGMIKDGLKQLSCGFKCVYELCDGVSPNGEKYQIIQKGIRGNHLASVPEGRMGESVSVAMDSLTFAIDNLKIEPKPDGGNDMTIEEMMAKVKEAQPAKEELKKLAAEIQSMIGDDVQAEEVEVSEDEEVTEEVEVAEDMDTEKPEHGMDAAAFSAAIEQAVTKAVKPLQDKITKLEGSAMDESAVMAAFNERQELINQVTPIIGNFEHSSMNRQQVAKYATEKLGIACDSGAEVTALKAYLHGRQKPTFTVDTGTGQDSAAEKSDVLDEMGL